MKELMVKYSNRAYADEKILEVQLKLDKTEDIMRNNIAKIMDRGDSIETLVDKTDILVSRSDTFMVNTTKLRKRTSLFGGVMSTIGSMLPETKAEAKVATPKKVIDTVSQTQEVEIAAAVEQEQGGEGQEKEIEEEKEEVGEEANEEEEEEIRENMKNDFDASFDISKVCIDCYFLFVLSYFSPFFRSPIFLMSRFRNLIFP